MPRLTGPALEERILMEANGILAIDKCPGLPTSGRSLDDEDCLQRALIERHGAMVWAVHQLDADTSGVNLFTTEKRLVPRLQGAMQSRGSAKTYWALAHGHPRAASWECREPIGFVDERSLGVTASGRAALTRVELVATAAEHCALRVRIETGRTHQIRIHLAHLGHPLVGEEWYRAVPCTQHPRQALHARSLRLGEPFDLTLRAPIPADLANLAQRLGFPSSAWTEGQAD